MNQYKHFEFFINYKWIIIFMCVQEQTFTYSQKKDDITESKILRLLKNKNSDNSLERLKVKYNTDQVSDLSDFSIAKDDEDEFDKEEFYRLQPILEKLNKVLVKRVIPQGYRTPNLQYDKAFNSFYKPLFRFHRINTKEELPVKNYNQNEKSDNHENYSGESDEMLLQLFKKKIPERYIEKYEGALQKNILADIVFLLNAILSKSSKKNPVNYQKLMRLFDDFETHVRIALRGKPENPADVVKKESKNKALPFYHLWNKWTYQSTALHDECPPNQMSADNICIQV